MLWVLWQFVSPYLSAVALQGSAGVGLGLREGILVTHGAEFFGEPAECSAARRSYTGVGGISRQIPGAVFSLLPPLLFEACEIVG